jgi:ankyrin repeat protein
MDSINPNITMDLIKELILENPNKERLLELITDENISYIDRNGYTPLMCAFIYGKNFNCDSTIFDKMFDMNCRLEQVNDEGYTALILAFKYYGSNPKCNPNIFKKMLDRNCVPEQVIRSSSIIGYYAYQNGHTPLMHAFMHYGRKPNCESSILSKILDMNCKPEQAAACGTTALMYAFLYYGSNPNCDHNILLKLLDMDCKPEQVTKYYIFTALMYAFLYYGTNPNCNSKVLLKLLDMNCNPKQVNQFYYTALMYAFKHYAKNPICDPYVFLKLILLLHPLITRSKLIEVLDKNNTNHNLKNNIIKAYLYNRRRTIINSRISKRVLKGKYDSISIFD